MIHTRKLKRRIQQNDTQIARISLLGFTWYLITMTS